MHNKISPSLMWSWCLAILFVIIKYILLVTKGHIRLDKTFIPIITNRLVMPTFDVTVSMATDINMDP